MHFYKRPAGHSPCGHVKRRVSLSNHNLKGSTMKNAYVVGHITIKDEAKWAEYRRQVPETLEPYGAELVFRGKLLSILSGNHTHTDTVVIRFPDATAINGWYLSPTYQSLIPLREEAADMDLLLFEE